MSFTVLPNFLHYTQTASGVSSSGNSLTFPLYNLSDYPSLSGAINTIGTGKNVTLLVTQSGTISGNTTVYPNYNLVFLNSGILTIKSGATLTIRGGIDAPSNKKIFDNILSGQGAVSFVNNKAMSKFQLNWWGVPNDYSLDATPYIQAAIDSVPDNSIIEAPQHQYYALYDTIRFYRRIGVELITKPGNIAGYSNYLNNLPFSSMQWSGAISGTMISLDRSKQCNIQGWTFLAGGTSGAQTIIDIDGYNPGISSQHFIRDNHFRLSSLTGAIGVSISKTAINNNEFMTLERNSFDNYSVFRSGYGLYMGSSSNAHGHILRDNNFAYLNHGIHMDNGSFQMEGLNNFGDNNVDIWINDTAYPTIIRGADSENSYQFAYINAQNNAVLVDSCRMQSSGHTSGEGLIQFGLNARYATVSNNTMTNIATSSGVVFDNRGASNLYLVTINNRYPTNYNDDQIYKECWHGNSRTISLDRGKIAGPIVAKGKSGPHEPEYPPILFENIKSGAYFTDLLYFKATGALEWDNIRLHMTQSGLNRLPIAYTTDITGVNALFTGVNGIQVTGFTRQTGVIGISGLGSVTVLTGVNNFIYISGSTSVSSNATNVFTGASISVTGFSTQTGNINFSGLGSVIVLTGINNFIYFSGSSANAATAIPNAITGSGNITYIPLFVSQTGISNSTLYQDSNNNIIFSGQLNSSLNIYNTTGYISWLNMTTTQSGQGLTWFSPGVYGARLRTAPSNGDLVFTDVSSNLNGTGNERFRVARGNGDITCRGTIFTKDLSFGTTTSQGVSTIIGRNFTNTTADSIRFQTFGNGGANTYTRLTITESNGVGSGTNAAIKIGNCNLIVSGDISGSNYFSGFNVLASNTLSISGQTAITGIRNNWTDLTWNNTTSWATNPNKTEDRARLYLTGNTTLSITNLFDGWNGLLQTIQSGNALSGYNLTLPANTKVMNGGLGIINLTSGSGARDMINLYYDGSFLFANFRNNFN